MRRLALAALLLGTAGALAASQEEVFEKAFSMEGVSRISVENVNGRIDASTWDKPYLKVRAVKRVSGSRSDEVLRQTEIRIRKVGDEIRLETVNPHRHHLFGFLNFGWHNPRVDYEIHFPAGTKVRLETTNGQVQGSGLDGSVSCDTVNGSIELSEISGPVRAATVNGGLRVAFRGTLKKSELETVNGSVEVAFDRSSSVRYDLQTVNGRIEGDIDLAVEGRHGPKEARGSYNGGSETLRCETVNGSIRLKTK
jgi:hypothetical protein